MLVQIALEKAIHRRDPTPSQAQRDQKRSHVHDGERGTLVLGGEKPSTDWGGGLGPALRSQPPARLQYQEIRRKCCFNLWGEGTPGGRKTAGGKITARRTKHGIRRGQIVKEKRAKRVRGGKHVCAYRRFTVEMIAGDGQRHARWAGISQQIVGLKKESQSRGGYSELQRIGGRPRSRDQKRENHSGRFAVNRKEHGGNARKH